MPSEGNSIVKKFITERCSKIFKIYDFHDQVAKKNYMTRQQIKYIKLTCWLFLYNTLTFIKKSTLDLQLWQHSQVTNLLIAPRTVCI